MQLSIPSTPYVCNNLIGDQWRPALRGEVREVISPYTNQVIGRVAMSGADDVAAAVAAARNAAAACRVIPVKERTQALFRLRQLLIDHLDELGHSAAAEAGKTIGEAT